MADAATCAAVFRGLRVSISWRRSTGVKNSACRGTITRSLGREVTVETYIPLGFTEVFGGLSSMLDETISTASEGRRRLISQMRAMQSTTKLEMVGGTSAETYTKWL